MINYAVVLAMVCVPMAFASAQNNSFGGSQEGQAPDQPVSGEEVQIQIESVDQEQEREDSEISESAPAVDASQEEGQRNRNMKNNPDKGQQQSREAKSGTATAAQEQGGPNERALQRRSRVANAVQEIVGVSERNQNVGEQIREVARKQKQYHQKIRESAQQAQQRSGLVKFLIGPDYDELKQARENMDKYGKQIEKLEEMKDEIADQQDKEEINEQIEELEGVKQEWQQELEDSERGFSLLGWMVKLFS